MKIYYLVLGYIKFILYYSILYISIYCCTLYCMVLYWVEWLCNMMSYCRGLYNIVSYTIIALGRPAACEILTEVLQILVARLLVPPNLKVTLFTLYQGPPDLFRCGAADNYPGHLLHCIGSNVDVVSGRLPRYYICF